MTSHTPLARHIAPRIDEARLTRQLALIRARLGPEGSRARVFGFAVAFAAVAAVGMLVYRMRAPVDLADASALALFETHSAGERVTIAGRAALVLDAESR